MEKHGQSQGYKYISRDLNVPVFTVHNVIQKFTAHGTAANLPGRGRKRKIDERLQQRIVRIVNKEPRSTSKQIQADLQTQGTTVSARTICHHLNEMRWYDRRPRRTPLLTQRHKKARLEFVKTYLRKQKSFWENVMWTDQGRALYCTLYIIVLFIENEMRPSKKRTRSLQSNVVEVHICFGVALLLLAH